jgi:hypothetical protein
LKSAAESFLKTERFLDIGVVRPRHELLVEFVIVLSWQDMIVIYHVGSRSVRENRPCQSQQFAWPVSRCSGTLAETAPEINVARRNKIAGRPAVWIHRLEGDPRSKRNHVGIAAIIIRDTRNAPQL